MLVILEVRTSFFMQNYTNDIPECRNETLLHDLGTPTFTQKQNLGKKNTTYHGQKTKKMASCVIRQEINLIIIPPVASKKRQNNNAAERDKGKELPPSKVAIERCSEHSVASESIRIGAFGMSASRKRNVTTLNIAIRKVSFQWSSS